MTTLALPPDKALSCGKEQKRKNLTAWLPLLHHWPWADSSPSLSLCTGRVILYSVTPSTVKEPTDSVCVERKCELKRNALESLRSTVCKQMPPEVGPECLSNWLLRDQKKQASLERQGGGELWRVV